MKMYALFYTWLHYYKMHRDWAESYRLAILLADYLTGHVVLSFFKFLFISYARLFKAL